MIKKQPPPDPGLEINTRISSCKKGPPHRAPSAFQEGLMTKTKTSDEKKNNAVLQWFVFGLDKGKPVGARFPKSEMKVFQVAEARSLEVHAAYSEEIGGLGMRLPVGRIYARGKAFVPHIAKDLFDKLQAAIARDEHQHERSQVERTAAAARQAKNGAAKSPIDNAATPVVSGLPRSWDEIAPGHLVLAEESLPEGYWLAIVVSREKDILVLRYRDYPRARQITRHVATIALLNPGAA
jgi:hypothetical protein